MEGTGAGQWGHTGDTQGTHRGLRCGLSTHGHTGLCPLASGRAGQCLSLPLWCRIEGVNTQIGGGRQRVDAGVSFLSHQLANVLMAHTFSPDSQHEGTSHSLAQRSHSRVSSLAVTASEEGKSPSSELDLHTPF